MDTIYGEIYLASEYDQFKLVKGNRQVSPNKKLEESILEKGVLRPIAVTSNMEIIDGQHRYTIAKKYNIPLPYYVSVSKNIDDIIDLNNASHKWTVEDYINKYQKDGVIDYIKLEMILNKYKPIALADVSSAAEGYLKKSHKSINNIKEGKFKFVNYNEFIVCLDGFQEFIYKTQIKSASGIFITFFNIYSVKKFDLQSFIERMNVNDIRNKIIGVRDEKVLLKLFVETYNYKLRERSAKYIDYKIEKNRSITILEERKSNLLSR